MSATLSTIAKALGGEVSGKSVLAPGPGHSSSDRSLSVTPSPTDPDGFVVHSHAGDDWRTCRAYVAGKLGLSVHRPRRDHASARSRLARAPQPKQQDAAQNQKLAMRIWCEAGDPRGSLAEHYLQSRGLDLPDEAAGEAIRFHPSCPFGAERLPAMIALVRNIRTNEPQAIQRTALTSDGIEIRREGKTLRMTLGASLEGAIKIDPNEDVTQGLCIGEGFESTLSGRQKEGLRPAWALLNTGGIANFPVLAGLDGLRIFMENDANGASARAAQQCASRWYLAGRDVLIVIPDKDCNDLNDELRKGQRQ